ncbi:hypothetical protein QTP88_028320 [Uroleucon formosanum]
MDCTPDISHNEQLSLLFRIVNMNDDNSHNPEIQEYFLDFIPVQSTTGLNLSNVLIDKLNEYGIGIMNCRGQAYDNGSNMVGKYQGVQTRVTNQNPRAFFTPCASHNLNLVLRDTAKNSSRASTFFGTVQRIYTTFSASTSRWDIFKKCCSIFTVKQWSETRWESRVNSVKALRFQLPNIIEALEEVSETSNDSIAKSDARSLITEICTYEFILSLIIWYDILVQVNIVSKSLQGKDAIINISNDMLQSLLAFLKSYRETGFMNVKIIANNLAEEIEVEPAFKKTKLRKKKKTFDYEGNDERINDGEENFRQEYFLLVQLKNVLNKLNHIKIILGFYFVLENYNILIVNEETTHLEALSVVKYSSECFPNIGIALRILLTIPVTLACAERSFSKLKLIKTYLRNKLSQENLSGLSIISIEKDIAESLDYDYIINQFAAKKSRKALGAVNNLSKVLQKENLQLSSVPVLISSSIGHLKNISDQCSSIDENNSIHTCINTLKKYVCSSRQIVENENKMKSLKKAKQFVDTMIEQMQLRFNVKSLEIIKLSALFESFESLIKIVEEDILKICLYFPSLEPTNVWIDLNSFKYVANSLIEENVKNPMSYIYKANIGYENLKKLAECLMCVPVSTATAERSFSTMNRIMNKIRNRMRQETLQSCMKISTEGPSELDEDTVNEVIDLYARQK